MYGPAWYLPDNHGRFAIEVDMIICAASYRQAVIMAFRAAELTLSRGVLFQLLNLARQTRRVS